MSPGMQPPSADLDDRAIISALADLAAEPQIDIEPQVFALACRIPGPVCAVHAAFSHKGVLYLRNEESLGGDPQRFEEAFRERFQRPLRTAARPPAGLAAALAGRRGIDVPLDLCTSTKFHAEVLSATARIPWGQTRPYSWVAKEVGRPGAVRAVGTALAQNPVPLLVPCHRVILSDGDLGGYVFGQETKERLLRHEAADLEGVRELARQGVRYVASTTTRVYCFPTCHHAKRISAHNRKGFRQAEDAERAGYRPCRSCRPGRSMTASAPHHGA